MQIVASTADARFGYDEENKGRDYVAFYANRNTANLLDLWVGPTAPAHKAGRIWIKTG